MRVHHELGHRCGVPIHIHTSCHTDTCTYAYCCTDSDTYANADGYSNTNGGALAYTDSDACANRYRCSNANANAGGQCWSAVDQLEHRSAVGAARYGVYHDAHCLGSDWLSYRGIW